MTDFPDFSCVANGAGVGSGGAGVAGADGTCVGFAATRDRAGGFAEVGPGGFIAVDPTRRDRVFGGSAGGDETHVGGFCIVD